MKFNPNLHVAEVQDAFCKEQKFQKDRTVAGQKARRNCRKQRIRIKRTWSEI